MAINVGTYINYNSLDRFGVYQILLHCKEKNKTYDSKVEINYNDIFKKCGKLEPIIEDLLMISNIVYSVDKLYSRKEASDGWTREINIKVPVQEVVKLTLEKGELEKCLSFLTGDIWSFEFAKLNKSPFEYTGQLSMKDKFDCVSLFSGGLDSLIGVIDWMEENETKKIMMVGHHDKKVPGPKKDQERVLSVLNKEYQGQFDTMLVGTGQEPTGKETTYRSRSFVFIILGICAVSSELCINKKLIIPENGTIAINYPLTPSRRGSCSTRTTHPFFLKSLSNIFNKLDIDVKMYNPYKFNTKGESVSKCKNRMALIKSIKMTRSCAKSGHTNSWVRKSSKNCGRCMPCIYRRAALHTIEKDDEVYGNDVCKEEVNIESKKDKSVIDFRACIMFLNNHDSDEVIARKLYSNGKIDINDISNYVDLIKRTKNEVRKFLIDKSTSKVKGWIK